jgi:hypothetical protein
MGASVNYRDEDEDWNSGGRRHRGGEVAAIKLVRSLLSHRPVIRPRDVQGEMGSRWWMAHLVKIGELVKVGDGLYSLPGRLPCPSELALAIAPQALLGLTSALWANQLLVDEPVPVHLVLPRGVQAPRSRGVPLCISWARDAGNGWNAPGGPRPLLAHLPCRALIDCLRYPCGLPADRVEQLAHRALTFEVTTPGQLLDAAATVGLGGEKLRFVEAVIARWRRRSPKGPQDRLERLVRDSPIASTALSSPKPSALDLHPQPVRLPDAGS